MLFEVIEDYQSAGDKLLIELVTGDIVELGEETDPNGEYPNWIFCTSQRTGRTGWVATQLITKQGEIGIVNQDYSSKEMTVCAGDLVNSDEELNGWYWCTRVFDSECGWIPKVNLKLINPA